MHKDAITVVCYLIIDAKSLAFIHFTFKKHSIVGSIQEPKIEIACEKTFRAIMKAYSLK